jgi:hypothetical protein
LRAELELLGHILGRDLTSQFPAAAPEPAGLSSPPISPHGNRCASGARHRDSAKIALTGSPSIGLIQ